MLVALVCSALYAHLQSAASPRSVLPVPTSILLSEAALLRNKRGCDFDSINSPRSTVALLSSISYDPFAGPALGAGVSKQL